MLNKLKAGLSAIAAFGEDLARFRQRLEGLEEGHSANLTYLEQFEARQRELESTVKTTTLEHAELYGKTYRLLKRMQMEDRTAEEEPDIGPVDPVTERVRARRRHELPRG